MQSGDEDCRGEIGGTNAYRNDSNNLSEFQERLRQRNSPSEHDTVRPAGIGEEQKNSFRDGDSLQLLNEQSPIEELKVDRRISDEVAQVLELDTAEPKAAAEQREPVLQNLADAAISTSFDYMQQQDMRDQ